MSLRARRRESSWAAGGSITSTTGANPPRRNSTPLPSTSSRKPTNLGSTLDPRAVEFCPSNLNPTPQSNNFESNLETKKTGNSASVGYPPEKEAVAATGDQFLYDAAYAASLYLEEAELLDPLLEEAYRAGLFPEEADVASEGYKNILGDRKVVLTRQFLKLQEDALWAFQPGAGTDKGGDVSHVTPPLTTSAPPPLSQQDEEIAQQLGPLTLTPQSPSDGKVETSPTPGSSILDPSVLSPSQDTSTNNLAPREGMVIITADLSSPEVATELEAAARSAGEEVIKMEKRLHEVEQYLERFDAQACSGSEPLAPQLSLLRREYRRIKICSLDLAIKVANYSRRFSESMIPNCLDSTIPLSERKDALEDYINEARNFATVSEDITTQWTHIKDKYLKLISSFRNWGSPGEVAKLNDLGHLKQTMMGLEVQMESSARTATTMSLMLAGTTLAAIIIASIGLWKFREAPGHLVKLLDKQATNVQALAEQTGMLSVLSTGIRTVEEVAQKPQKIRESLQQTQRAIHQKEREIQGLRGSRDQLEELGSHEATTFSEVIALCLHIWTQTRNDAVNLREYLEAGERNVNRPKFLADDLNKAGAAYIHMANYLRQYADAIKLG